MSRSRSYTVAVLFLIILALPGLDQWLGLSSRFTSTENRKLNRSPSLHIPHFSVFIKQFDRYYKENFGWRNALFYAYSRWKFNVVQESPLPEKVILGKNGWMYLGNSYNKVVDQHRGLQPLSSASAQRIARHLLERQQELAGLGARLYILVAPDSHTIYPEYLPNHLQQSTGPSRLDVLKEAITARGLPFVDVRDTLLAAKREHRVYYQTDTHWNEYGTLVGSAQLLNRIRQDQPTLPATRLADYHVEKRPGRPGDLSTMLMLQDEHRDSICYRIKPLPARAARQTAVLPNKEAGYPSTRFAGSGTGRLLVIGDSFSHGLMNYLPGYFRESYFIRGRRLNPALVKVEKPTVVVIEVVERNIYQLATF